MYPAMNSKNGFVFAKSPRKSLEMKKVPCGEIFPLDDVRLLYKTNISSDTRLLEKKILELDFKEAKIWKKQFHSMLDIGIGEYKTHAFLNNAEARTIIKGSFTLESKSL